MENYIKTYVFDLDNTLCTTIKNSKGFWEYEKSTPKINRINLVNSLYDKGNYIIIDTARGAGSGKDFTKLTENQLNDWGLKFHEVRSGVKFPGDYYIDDKAVNSEDFFNDKQ
tara:strand:- start:1390 stop:1725 length:336 start_codon:yes stop_codon:yes gene_type:complete